jgi:type III pantothenate kinase
MYKKIYLVGDIGNTLTKVCLLNSDFKIFKSFILETNKIHKKNYLNKFFKRKILLTLNIKILFSSVVPSVFIILKKFFNKKNFKVYEIKNLKIKNIIKLNVDNIKQVGSDRIANAIGSYHNYKTNCIVIDFGTATTFDIVKKDGIYDGGVIAPGIKLSIQNLHKSTALLPSFILKTNNIIYGKNTLDALNAGFLLGYQGLINNIIKKITLSSKKNYKIILTGGYAQLFKKYVYKKTIIDQNITIKGIIKIYKDLLV